MTSHPYSRSILNRVLAILSFGCVFSLGVAAQDGPAVETRVQAQNEEPAKSKVTGHVVYDDSERPVRRVLVRLVQMERGPERSAATNRSGKFVISGVKAGHYFVWVDAPGMITPIAFMSFTEDGGAPQWNEKDVKEFCDEVIVDGTNDVNVTVHARRGGAISGKITYQDGEPAINVQIGVVSKRGENARRVLAGVSAGTLGALRTDDRGMYRVAGLPPGEYVVSAAEQNTSSETDNSRNSGLDEFFKSDALSMVYYGGTGKLGDATVVKIEAGTEAGDINITLEDAVTHSVSGSVIGRLDGTPLPRSTIVVRNRDEVKSFLQGMQSIHTDDQGKWVLPELADGRYVLSVEPPYQSHGPEDFELADDQNPRPDPPPRRQFVSRDFEVTVSGSDLVNVNIELPEAGSISGTLQTPAELEEVYVSLRWIYEDEKVVSPRNNSAAYSGKFTIERLRAGKLYLSANLYTQNTTQSYYVKSIMLGDRDLMTKPVTIEEGQVIKDVRIVVSGGGARANVLFTGSDGKPVTGKLAAIVPVEPSRWNFPEMFVSGVTDNKGILHFDGPPGEYLVITAGADGVWSLNPNFIRARATGAMHVDLKSGDNATITVPPSQ